jgi:hypothetical protein
MEAAKKRVRQHNLWDDAKYLIMTPLGQKMFGEMWVKEEKEQVSWQTV